MRPRRDRLVVGLLPVGGGTKGGGHAISALEILHGSGAPVDPVVYDVDYPADAYPPHVVRYSKIAGAQRDIAAFYRHCDAFLLSSLVEGFPLPPLEAMSCGTAAVITDCGGMRDYAVDGENALIVPTADAGALAGALKRLAADEPLRAQLIEGGYETATRFPEERFVDLATAAVLRQLR